MKTISLIVLFTFFASAQCAITKEIATTPPPSVCTATKDLYAKNGKYLKSLCYVSSKKTFENADAFCKAKNMLLFVITTSDQYVALKSAVKSQFNRNTIMQFWINGRQDRNGFWYIYGSKVAKIHDDAVPSYTYKKNTNALSFMIDFGYYYTERESSAKLLLFFCEYLIPTTTTTTQKTKTTKIPTTAAPTTTATPQFCAKNITLKDPKTGAYIKTACIVLNNLNYIAASNLCIESGMALLAIATNEDFLSVKKYIYPGFKKLSITDAWINGYVDTAVTGVWIYSSTAGSHPIFAGAIPSGSEEYLALEVNGKSLITVSYALGKTQPFVCEFFDLTQMPATTTTIAPTTIATNTLICATKTKINSPSTGSYMKTACITSGSYDNMNGLNYCKENGMLPFAIATDDEYTTLQTLLPDYTALQMSDAWIGGSRQTSGSWIVDTKSGSMPLYSSAVPMSSAEGDGLTVQLDGTSLKTISRSSASEFAVICEFVESASASAGIGLLGP